MGLAGKSEFNNERECAATWEEKPAPEEKDETKALQVPSTSVCSVSTDTEGDSPEDLKSEAEIHEMEVSAKSLLNFLLLNLYSYFTCVRPVQF